MPNPLSALFGNLPQPNQAPGSAPPAPQGGPSLDINTLLTKLIATGIIKKEPEQATTVTPPGETSTDVSVEDKKEEPKGIKPLELMNIRKKVTF